MNKIANLLSKSRRKEPERTQNPGLAPGLVNGWFLEPAYFDVAVSPPLRFSI